MSRIGKKSIKLPKGVSAEQQDCKIIIKGPKGNLVVEMIEGFILQKEEDNLSLAIKDENQRKKLNAFHGLYGSLLQNAVVGVSEGFSKTLNLEGVGYRANLAGNVLNLAMGYSHPVQFTAPQDIKLEVPNQTTIIVSGIDKQEVGQVAANIREIRKPEPYKGKGIKYKDETVRRKAGKTGKK